MPADGEDDEEDAGAGTPGGLTAQALWDSRAVTWAAATQVHERSKRQKLVTKKWPLPLHKLPGTGAQGESRLEEDDEVTEEHVSEAASALRDGMTRWVVSEAVAMGAAPPSDADVPPRLLRLSEQATSLAERLLDNLVKCKKPRRGTKAVQRREVAGAQLPLTRERIRSLYTQHSQPGLTGVAFAFISGEEGEPVVKRRREAIRTQPRAVAVLPGRILDSLVAEGIFQRESVGAAGPSGRGASSTPGPLAVATAKARKARTQGSGGAEQQQGAGGFSHAAAAGGAESDSGGVDHDTVGGGEGPGSSRRGKKRSVQAALREMGAPRGIWPPPAKTTRRI